MTYDPKLFIDGYSAPANPGLYHINVSGTYTAAQIGDIGNAVNTTGKTLGKKIWNSTNDRVLEASGTTAASPWTAPNGSTSITPA